jgi:hypothetical protein
VTRHRFDPLALLLGVVALALGVGALAGWLGPLVNTPAGAVAIVVGLLGALLVASAYRRPSSASRPAPSLDEQP